MMCDLLVLQRRHHRTTRPNAISPIWVKRIKGPARSLPTLSFCPRDDFRIICPMHFTSDRRPSHVGRPNVDPKSLHLDGKKTATDFNFLDGPEVSAWRDCHYLCSADAGWICVCDASNSGMQYGCHVVTRCDLRTPPHGGRKETDITSSPA